MSNYNQQKLLSLLQTKWRSVGCPMCAANQWGVSDKAMELREFNQGNLIIGGAIQPVIPVNCGNCGYTVLINGLIAGVIDRPKDEEAK